MQENAIPTVLEPEPLESGQIARVRSLSPRPAEWPAALRVLFRFVCVYFLVYNFPAPFSWVPLIGSALAAAVSAFWDWIVPPVARLIGVTYAFSLAPNGSGDTTALYIRQLCILVAAVAGAALWTVLARARSYARAHEWLRLNVRLVLGVTMFSYGLAKVLPMQFGAITPERLVQPLGEFSPMGLLWTFMGYSVAYNVFAGLGELVGGMLLAFRRTTTLGALLLIGVMSNVVILNYTYDVPVKLFSTNLLLMAVFLAAPDARRLLNVLVLNRTAEPAAPATFFPVPKWHRAMIVATVAVLGLQLTVQLRSAVAMQGIYGRNAPKPAIYGVYEAESFERNGETIVAVPDDGNRWKRIAAGGYWLSVYAMNDERARYRMVVDTAAATVTLTRGDTASVLRYDFAQPDLLVLEGSLAGDALRAVLRRRDSSDFMLMSRGFNWINEAPFNR